MNILGEILVCVACALGSWVAAGVAMYLLGFGVMFGLDREEP